MPRWGAAPLCGMTAASWDGWEASSPRAAGGVELEQEPEDSQTCGSSVQADEVTKPTPVSTNKSRLYHKD